MLINPCKYSFKDLLTAADAAAVSKKPIETAALYKLSQQDRNRVVKDLCKICGWYFEDVKGSDGVIYTAFSPEYKNT